MHEVVPGTQEFCEATSVQTLSPSRSHMGFAEHVRELARLAELSAESCAESVMCATGIVADALRSGHKILACGNGGSAADAQHFVAEFVGRYLRDRPALAAVSLTCDSSIVTALGNDYGYETIFARQIEAIGHQGDVLVALSTSGRSANVLEAARTAWQMGMKVIALTGPSFDTPLASADAWCRVESPVTAHIQEIHIAMLHSICAGSEYLLGLTSEEQ